MTDQRAEPTETAIIVPVPTAEPVAGRHRQLLDPTASWGVPAHVTVISPFVPPHQVTEDTIAEVRASLDGLPAFDCTFSQIKWFREDVMWLAPEPAEAFRELTRAVWRRFPDHPPYEGVFPEITPHLTIGYTEVAGLDALRRAATEVQPELPVTAKVNQIRMMVGTQAPDSWRTLAEFPLPTG